MKEIKTFSNIPGIKKFAYNASFLRKLIKYILYQNEEINYEDMKNKNRHLIQDIEPKGIPIMMKENPRMTAVQ